MLPIGFIGLPAVPMVPLREIRGFRGEPGGSPGGPGEDTTARGKVKVPGPPGLPPGPPGAPSGCFFFGSLTVVRATAQYSLRRPNRIRFFKIFADPETN